MIKKIVLAVTFLIIIVAGVLYQLENFEKESKEMATEFLMSFYTTTEDEISDYENYYVPDTYETWDNYEKSLYELYDGLLSDRARMQLISYREIDNMSHHAYINNTSFKVESLKLTIFDDAGEDDIVYAYVVKVKDEKSGIITEIFGQIRVQNIEGETLITATHLDNTGSLREAYLR